MNYQIHAKNQVIMSGIIKDGNVVDSQINAFIGGAILQQLMTEVKELEVSPFIATVIRDNGTNYLIKRISG